MAHRELILALSMIVGISPASATQTDRPREAIAPAAPADARYCLRVEAITGSRMETVRCMTREDWARLEVDVDQEWAENGVRIIGRNPAVYG
jgi:hypothetical protein